MESTDSGAGLVIVRAAEARRNSSAYLHGVIRDVLASDPNLLLAKHTLPKGTHVDRHEHPQEQLVYMISGRLRWEVGGQSFEITTGDSIIIKSGVPHECWSLEDSVSLDVFHPTRPDFVNQSH